MKISKVFFFCLFIGVSACSRVSAPEILRNLDCDDHNSCVESGKQFRARVLAEFPIGSAEATLENELVTQGFIHSFKGVTKCLSEKEIAVVRPGTSGVVCPSWDQNWNPTNSLAYFFTNGFFNACSAKAGVDWSSEGNGRITYVNTYVLWVCL